MKSIYRNTAGEKEGNPRHQLKLAFVRAVLIAAVCTVPTAATLAAFSNVQQPQSGYNNFFSGHTRITSGTLNNSGSMSSSFSSLTASTGNMWGWDTYVNGGNPTKSGNYYYGLGVLAWNPNVGANGTTTINNNSGATMQGIVTGSGKAFAAGLYSIQYQGGSSTIDMTVNNSGTMNGEVRNNDGTAAGCLNLTSAGGGTVNNNSGGRCSATAKYYATAIINQCYFGAAKVVNSGTATCTASGGTQGTSAGRAYACGIDVYSYSSGSSAPVNFQNYGSVSGTTTGGTTQKAYGAFVWAQGGTMNFKNTGSITASSTSASGARCEAVYCGSTGGNDTFYNSGTIRGTAGGQGGWGVGCENDSVGQTFKIYNSGTIWHNNGYGLYVQGYGSNENGYLYITNTATGSISGTLGCGSSHWNGPTIFENSGTITGPIDLGPKDDTVYMKGTGSVTGTVRGNAGNDRLIFSLSGTLQSVNGVTATKGGNLANYSLGQSGNIVVSGKTYKWDSCTVSGSAAN